VDHVGDHTGFVGNDQSYLAICDPSDYSHRKPVQSGF
jgi:hypothetical protein